MTQTTWKPNPGPQEFVLSLPNNTYELLYGGARGGGKTDAGLAWIGEHQANPRYRALVIRKNADDLADWVDRVRVMYPHAAVAYRPAIITFPSGAVIRTGHLKDDQAYTKYQGQEYQRMLIEELTQIPTEKRYLQLASSCRSTIPSIPSQLMATTNPGGVGHAWVKKRFINFSKPFVRKPDPTSGRLRVFVPAKVDDNPVLMTADPDYVKSLDALHDTDIELWKAWRLGDWEVFAGQAFKEWRYDKHVVSTFDYPLDQCDRIISFDWGYRDKGVATWLAFTPENRWGVRRCYMYRQLVQTETDPDTWADQIATYCSVDKVKYMVMPSDTYAHKQDRTTIASIFEAALRPYRVPLVKADMSSGSRLNRKAITHKFLADAPDGKPYLQVHESCTDWIESLPTLVYDERNVEDIAAGDDHCLRYDTQVLTTDGYQNIGDLVGKEGLLVSDGSIERYHSVRKTGTATIYELTFANGAIVHTSSEHPFLTDRGWVAAIDIRPTDRIQCIHEGYSSIRDKTNIQRDKLLPNGVLLSTHEQEIQGIEDTPQDSMGISQRPDTKRGASTSQRSQQSEQSGGEPRAIESESALSRTYGQEPSKPRMAREKARANPPHDRKSESMAQITRGDGVAQESLRRDGAQNACWVALKTRKKLGREPVYNLEVDNTHCFAIQGGIIVHNSWDSGTYGIVAYVESKPGFIIKASNEPAKPKQWAVNNGVIKPEEDIMDKIKTGMTKSSRDWQS